MPLRGFWEHGVSRRAHGVVRTLLLLQLCVGLFVGCEEEVAGPLETSFYHWETELVLADKELALLDRFGCRQLFVKAFDVSWEGGQLATSAWLETGEMDSLPELVPVVFITNEVLAKTETEELAGLAQSILQLTDELLPATYRELQLDCDWTARTQVPYFALLQAVQTLRPGLSLSCTLRLHQYRDRATQGIPPVERATLMAYNTGRLSDWETENSILDTNIITTYLAGQPAYPIPLDLGIAVYDWAAVYRRGDLAYLINEPGLSELADSSRFRQMSPLRYEVVRSTYLDGLYLYSGDLLRREVVGPETLERQTERLGEYVGGFPGQRRLVYRLGSRLWKNVN